MKKLLFITAACVTSLTIQAQIWEFDLAGLGGPGLTGASEPGAVVPSTASGGELNEGFPGAYPSINYNVATKQLQVPIGWGTANGFTDLTGDFTAWHIHGPVSSDPGDDVNDYFTRSTSPLPDYSASWVLPNDQTGDGSRRDASFNTIITLVDKTLNGSLYSVAQQEQDLRNGRWYINVHSSGTWDNGEGQTGTYGGGEIRGQLLYVIPEPEHYAAMAGFALLAFAGYRRYKNAPAKA